MPGILKECSEQQVLIIEERKIHMNKNRLMAGAMAVTMTVGTVGLSGVNVYAADGTESQKEEVIYIMTDSDGNVENINAVNIFGKGDVTDYGDYSSVKMLNTTDKINQSGDKITFSSDKEKVYYQGTMKDTQIPWNISFTYTLDGKEISPEDLAGKSGALTIHVKVDKNEECTSDFYDNTALQATLTLDTEKCENITADGATLANVGANKQISYTVLPGKGLDAEISADVTDFEMDAIAINGVKMNLDVDIDDDELMDKVTQIMDASRELNDGAGELSDGADDLVDGGSSLVSGAESLDSGINSLNSGISSLSAGVNNIQSALNQLNGKSGDLTNGSAAVKQGIASAASGAANLQSAISYDAYKATMSQNGLDIDQLQAGNTQAISQISSQSSQLSTAIDQIKSTPGYESNQVFQNLVAQLENQKNSLDNIQTLLVGNNAAISGANQYYSAVAGEAGNLTSGLNDLNNNYATLDSGINEYINGVSQITSASAQLVEGTGTLASGSKELVKGSSSLKEGTSTLYSGMQSLNDGTKELKDGTQEFFDKTDGMDTKIEDTMDEMLDSITGGDSETESFVSDKNGTIDSVQFVIKTSAIEKKDTTKKETTETKELSLGEKILKLFGIEK